MNRVSLSLGYDVVLAPDFSGLSAALSAVVGDTRLLVVTNPTVRALHGEALEQELRPGFSMDWFEVPDGEQHKTLETWSDLIERMLAARPDRNATVLALGGGVIGDIAGFAASAVLRGVRFAQVPTTLLAMVDASVGGKTGVNLPVGKNLVGAFHQPQLVWAAMSALQTLPIAELRCGLGEVIKHAVLDGPVAVERCASVAEAVLARDPAALAEVVEHSVRFKARIVEADPFERGERALLNLGHTLAHGVENCAGYGHIRHGEAVGLGLVAIARWSVTQGLGSAGMAERLAEVVALLGLPTELPATLSPRAVAEAMRFDKKRGRGMVKFVVPFQFGDVRLCEVGEHALLALALAARAGASE